MIYHIIILNKFGHTVFNAIGVIQMQRSCRPAAVKKLLNTQKIHIDDIPYSLEKAVQYCMKEDTGVPHTLVAFGVPRTFSVRVLRDDAEIYKELIRVGDTGNGHLFKLKMQEKLPRDYIFNHRAVNYYLNSAVKATREPRYYDTFSLVTDFIDSVKAQIPDVNTLKTTCLFIHGPSGTGKSSLAKAILPASLIMSVREDLKKLKPEGIERKIRYSGVIADDVPITELGSNIESFIQFLDVSENRTFNVKYGSVQIPMHFPRIITSNYRLGTYTHNINSMHNVQSIT